MTQMDYQIKKQQVLANFSDEFVANYKNSATSNYAIEMLVRGEDPYAILERFLKDRDDIVNKMITMASLMPPAPIMIRLEDAEKLGFKKP